MPDILARLQLRAGTEAAWASANPILALGEPGFETDTRVLRIGDGSTPFLSLEKFETSDGFAATFQPLDDNLTAFSGLTFAANKLPYGTGIGSFALTDLTAEARTFLAAATKIAQRAALELTSAAITPVNDATNMTIEPTQLPTRGAVAGAILRTGGPAKCVTFTASGTFIKADHGQYPDDHMVVIQLWGGGGGGSYAAYGGGGGGGGYTEIFLKYSDIAASVPITVGSGGAIGSSGGNSLFGAKASAYGGGASSSSFWEVGGGGGAGAAGKGSDNGGLGGKFGGGNGGLGASNTGLPGSDATNQYGGGGGGGGGASRGGKGGDSIYGGGGGAGWGALGTQPATGAAGVSLFGGNGGGAIGEPGLVPGGGGSHQGVGARGEVRVWL